MANLSRVHLRSPLGEFPVSEGDQWCMTLDGYNLIACFSHALINLQLDEPTQANGRITESRTAARKKQNKNRTEIVYSIRLLEAYNPGARFSSD